MNYLSKTMKKCNQKSIGKRCEDLFFKRYNYKWDLFYQNGFSQAVDFIGLDKETNEICFLEIKHSRLGRFGLCRLEANQIELFKRMIHKGIKCYIVIYYEQYDRFYFYDVTKENINTISIYPTTSWKHKGVEVKCIYAHDCQLL